jgi:hypothetical protein
MENKFQKAQDEAMRAWGEGIAKQVDAEILKEFLKPTQKGDSKMTQDKKTIHKYVNCSNHRDPKYDIMDVLRAWSRFITLHDDALDVMDAFCVKVETGQARSVDTYGRCLEILKKAGRR